MFSLLFIDSVRVFVIIGSCLTQINRYFNMHAYIYKYVHACFNLSWLMGYTVFGKKITSMMLRATAEMAMQTRCQIT